MFKVSIQNLNDNRSWSGIFSSFEEANLWLEHQKLKDGRKPQRTQIILVDDLEVEETIPAEAEYSIEDISQQLLSDTQKLEAKKYLADTDWYIIRKMDTGVEVPSEIASLRQQCRELL